MTFYILKSKTLKYFNQIKSQDYFSEVNKNEASKLTPIFINILNSQYEKAEQLIDDAKDISPEDGFYPPIQLFRLMLLIRLDDRSSITTLLNQLELYFKEIPFQREMALYQTLEGMIHIQDGEMVKGKELLYMGIQAAKDTGFFLHYLNVFFISVFLLKDIDGSSICLQLQSEWRKLRKQCNVELVREEIEKRFFNSSCRSLSLVSSGVSLSLFIKIPALHYIYSKHIKESFTCYRNIS